MLRLVDSLCRVDFNPFCVHIVILVTEESDIIDTLCARNTSNMVSRSAVNATSCRNISQLLEYTQTYVGVSDMPSVLRIPCRVLCICKKKVLITMRCRYPTSSVQNAIRLNHRTNTTSPRLSAPNQAL